MRKQGVALTLFAEDPSGLKPSSRMTPLMNAALRMTPEIPACHSKTTAETSAGCFSTSRGLFWCLRQPFPYRAVLTGI